LPHVVLLHQGEHGGGDVPSEAPLLLDLDRTQVEGLRVSRGAA
jgi:hypothetical protein